MVEISRTRADRLLLVLMLSATGPAREAAAEDWIRSFPVDPTELSTVGENRYFILRPGYQLTLESPGRGKKERLVITVLDETKTVGGVETRVVEERETSGGALVEVSRNYYAISRRTNDVYYLGEDVDMYKRGKVTSHDGAWLHGTARAQLGLMMAGAPAVGARYYQEQAPGVAMDRAEVVSLGERAATPAGVFEGCVKTKETTPLEPFVREYKLYAPGIGLVKDGSLVLVSSGAAAPAAAAQPRARSSSTASKP